MPICALDGVMPEFEDLDSVWIAPDAALVGRISIARDVSIWFGSVLRGDNDLIAIGAGSNIQEHTVVHTDMGFPLTVGSHCTIGHRAILHGCTIGDESLVGMGAIVLNGARIGRNSLVGAGALVTEGKQFPDGSLIIGSPAKAVRALDESEMERVRQSARNYVRNGKRFKQGMA